jgi:hypothetical protein
VADRTVPRLKPRAEVAVPDEGYRDIVTASAQLLYGSAREQYAVQYKSWQQELWSYSKSVGEYGGVMDWFAAGISRMHLTAAIVRPGQREPELIDDDSDPAVQLMHRLVINAKNGETQYLYKWGRQLGVPGIGYFVGYTRDDGREVFDVKSAQQIRRSTQPFHDPTTNKLIKDRNNVVLTGYDVRTGPDQWIKLPYSQLVGRIYRPDDELDYEPTSWSRAALTTLREIDLLNRHIVATLLSRLVFNGLLFIPEEVTFPVNPQFKDAPDPFIAELLAVASRGIKDPGSPASALPFPIRVPAAFVDKFQHMIIASGIDAKIIEARTSAVQRLSEQLPAPPEAMKGSGDQNHWNAWKDSEDNVKMYFGPTMEVLCGGHTDVYVHPMLQAAGEPIDRDGGRVVAWYDASDLIVQPDNSTNAEAARDRIVIDDEAYRRLLGLDEEDKPTDDERREMILTDLSRQGLPLPDSYYLLYPDDKPTPQEMAQDTAAKTGMLDPATGKPVLNAGPSGAGRPVADQSNAKKQAPSQPSGAPAAVPGKKPAVKATPARQGG